MAHVFIKTIFRVIPGLSYVLSALLLVYLAIFDTEKYFYVMCFITLWFLISSFGIAFFSIIGLYTIHQTEQKEFNVMLQTLSRETEKDPYAVVHYVIIPNYNEPLDVLSETLDRISKSTISRDQIGIVLAMEKRETGAVEKAKELISKFSVRFRDMIYSLHPSDIEGEQRGKGSNENWGVKALEKHLIEKKINLDMVLITITDADTVYHAQYFEALTYKFLMHPDQHRALFQTPIISYLNLVRVPFANRIISVMGALNELSRVANPFDIHITYSCYSISYRLWQTFGGFDVSNISEDVRTFVKAYLYTDGIARVTNINLPTLNYAVESDGWWNSLKEKFVQAKRHTWGVSEISCFIQDLYLRGLPQYTQSVSGTVYLIHLLYRLIESHWSPAIAVLFANISGIIFNYYRFVEPWWYGKSISINILNAATLLMKINAYFVIIQILLIITTLIAMYKYARDVKWWHYPYIIAEWLVMAIPTLLIFGCIPCWMSAMRFMFTDRFDYVVAKKNVLGGLRSVQVDSVSV